MQPILLATDGSPSAEAATREAFDLARRLELPLLVVSVSQEPTAAYGYYGYAEVAGQLRKARLAHIGTLLATLDERAAEAEIPCETLALEGFVGERICDAAREHHARLIVIGAHGWGPVGRLLHGSVSTYVLHHAPVPVLIVHGDSDTVVGAPPAVGAAATG